MDRDARPAALEAALRERLRRGGPLLVAFSGGVDSALLTAVAAEELGSRAVAVTAVSASLSRTERVAARAFVHDRGIAHVEVCTDEFDRPEYRANAGDRCYHCKSALLDVLAPLAALGGARIALGTNLDDLGDHRPGQRAASARGTVAPLLEAGLRKNDVRRISARLGLRTAEKPASACLASRVAYGDPVTVEIVERIEKAEDAVRALGFPVCRVRSHSRGSVARVEVPATEISRASALRTELDVAVRNTGFAFCALDLQGFASGRMNVMLGLPGIP